MPQKLSKRPNISKKGALAEAQKTIWFRTCTHVIVHPPYSLGIPWDNFIA
jgi:hypothetical protein